MKTLLINNHTKHLNELFQFLPGEIVVIEKSDVETIEPNTFDLIVISGGHRIPTVLNHPEEYTTEMELVRTTEKPILGICLGCEIICTAFGGTLKKLEVYERGEVTLDISSESLGSLLDAHTLTMYESHGIGIDALPPDFEICATSDHGPEIIKHKSRPIIGIQFHPEVEVSEKFWEWVLGQVR